MREQKFRFIFKNGNFFAKRYMTLDELLDSNFALEQMEESINSESNIYDLEDYPDYEVFKDEYTGLKDKNGVDVYEGDIVKVNYLKGIGVVGWNDKFCKFDISHRMNITPSDEFEVIGNIYEKPELLN